MVSIMIPIHEEMVEKALSPELASKVKSGSAHWVTVKEGPLEGRHILIDGARPSGGKKSTGKILAGHGIPQHVLSKLDTASSVKHEPTEHDKGTGEPIGNHPYRAGDKITYKREGSKKTLSGTVESVSGDTLRVNVKGATVNVPVSHVASSESGEREKPQPEPQEKPKPTKTSSNPFNREPPGGWTDADKVPDQHRKNAPAPREPKHKVGTKIHYGGDMANRPGEFEITGTDHIDGKPYYNMREIGGERQYKRIPEIMISDKDTGDGRTRFVPKDIHDKFIEDARREVNEQNRKFLEEQRKNKDREELAKKPPEPKVEGPFTERDASRYNNTTHFPTSTDKLNHEFSEQVKADRQKAIDSLKRSGVNDVPSDVENALKKLAEAHEHFMRENIRSREVAPPWTVTGRANYRGRPDKADAITRNASEKIDAAKENLQRVLHRYTHDRISSDDSDAAQRLQEKIDKAEKLQETYKQINSIVRKKKLTDEQKIQAIMDLGLKEETAKQALQPDYMGRPGIQSFTLQNNLANIKRMKSRVEELQSKQSDSSSSHEFDGGMIHDNVDDNRLQIFFNEKPGADMRQKLKSRGFRWAPSANGPNGEEGAWQRMRSPEAERIARQIVDADVAKSIIAFPIRKSLESAREADHSRRLLREGVEHEEVDRLEKARTSKEWKEVKKRKESKYGADETFADEKHDSYPLTKNGKPSRDRTVHAWDYINVEDNEDEYSPAERARIKSKIRRYAKQHFGLDLQSHDETKKSLVVVFPIKMEA